MKSIASFLLFAALSSAATPVDRIELQDEDGRSASFATAGKTTVVIFYSTVCPISNDYNDRLTAFWREYAPKGVQILVVNANANENLDAVKKHRQAAEYPFAVYRDPQQRLADAVGATVTPEAFILDSQGKVAYRGHIDDSRNPARVHNAGLKTALEEVLTGRAVSKAESKAFGCTIKRRRSS